MKLYLVYEQVHDGAEWQHAVTGAYAQRADAEFVAYGRQGWVEELELNTPHTVTPEQASAGAQRAIDSARVSIPCYQRHHPQLVEEFQASINQAEAFLRRLEASDAA